MDLFLQNKQKVFIVSKGNIMNPKILPIWQETVNPKSNMYSQVLK